MDSASSQDVSSSTSPDRTASTGIASRTRNATRNRWVFDQSHSESEQQDDIVMENEDDLNGNGENWPEGATFYHFIAEQMSDIPNEERLLARYREIVREHNADGGVFPHGEGNSFFLYVRIDIAVMVVKLTRLKGFVDEEGDGGEDDDEYDDEYDDDDDEDIPDEEDDDGDDDEDDDEENDDDELGEAIEIGENEYVADEEIAAIIARNQISLARETRRIGRLVSAHASAQQRE